MVNKQVFWCRNHFSTIISYLLCFLPYNFPNFSGTHCVILGKNRDLNTKITVTKCSGQAHKARQCFTVSPAL